MYFNKTLISILLLFSITIGNSTDPHTLVITQDDLISDNPVDSSTSEDEFPDYSSSLSDDDLNPGSWHFFFEPSSTNNTIRGKDSVYYSGVKNMIEASTIGDTEIIEAAISELEATAEEGNPHAQSVLGFLYGSGIGKRVGKDRSFLFHYFAADGGNLHSKMVLAYTYFRQDMLEQAAQLYAELAEAAIASYFISKEPPTLEPVRIHSGTEENKEALRKSNGVDNEDFQMTEYQALKGNAQYMYKIGVLYYYGLRGVRRDEGKALHWFSMAAEKWEPRAMEFLGEMYARGAGVERNYTRALHWLKLAADMKHYSAYNGLGYLHAKGYGVEQKNFTKAKEYFEIAAKHKDFGGNYNLGVLYLKGIGVERDVRNACQLFLAAADAGQPKALYQVAKMFHEGIGLRRNLQKAIYLYKIVAERGPWNSLSRWALQSYLKGDVGKALLLYSRMAELGYEVAQSNAAWILDIYGEHSLCIGESGLCTGAERHLRAHSLWWQASEQGNEHAALLIGDAYYYGRGTERDYERAAEAYMHAQTQANAQAMFNLGYMHEHGEGLPFDLHLAKRYYDQALQKDPAAKLPVTLALISLWIRKNYAGSFLVDMIDSLPQAYLRVKEWVDDVLMDEGNVTILALFVCLLTVLFLRCQHRRQHAAVVTPPQQQQQQR